MATKAKKTIVKKGNSSMKAKSRTIKKSNIKSTRRFPLWSIILIVAFIAGIGIYLVYKSFAAGPNLRFQILKNSACVNSVTAADSSVNIRISRTSGSQTINNIRVLVDGNPVATSPSSINGPVTNILIAQPTLSASPANHTIRVTGTKQSEQVEFSPYCEANGSTNVYVNVVGTTPSPNPNPTPNPSPGTGLGPRLYESLSQADINNGSVVSSGTESSSNAVFGERPANIWCNQGACSVSYNYGNPQQAIIKPAWNCTNGSGWAYKAASGPKVGRWLCMQDYVLANDSVVRPWLRVAACESGGNWAINTGNGYYGGVQFSLATWQSVGGQGLPSNNSAHEQAYRAEILRQRSGLGQWPVCGRYYGG